MATIIDYGFILPNTGDKGSVWFPALEHNITQLSTHTHDGTNSAKITSTNIVCVTQAVAAADWVADGGGTFVQEKTLPNDANYADVYIMLKKSNGEQLFLDVKLGTSAKKYKVYSNDSSLDATAYILV